MADAFAKLQARVVEKVTPHLAPGEVVLTFVAVEPAGRNKGGHGVEVILRAGWNLVRNRKAKEQAAAAGFPFGAKMVLVATQHRLLVFDQSAGSRLADADTNAVPGRLLGEVSYDRLHAVQGQNSDGHRGGGARAGWVVFQLINGELYQLTTWGVNAVWFGSTLDQVLASRR